MGTALSQTCSLGLGGGGGGGWECPKDMAWPGGSARGPPILGHETHVAWDSRPPQGCAMPAVSLGRQEAVMELNGFV